MKRYTIANSELKQTWVVECEDLRAFYSNGLPLEYIGADIQEQDITQEIADKKAQQEIKRQQLQAGVSSLKTLSGKSLSQGEQKQAIESLLSLLFDPDSNIAADLLRLAAQVKKN
jgi:hypothetical protein